MITYAEFLNRIKEQVSELTEDDYSVRILPVRRNNGVMFDSMIISRPGDMVCPNIYLNELYNWYKDGMSIPRIADRVLMQYRSAMPEGAIDVEALMSRDSVCGNIVYRLVNSVRNKDLLEEIPHREFLDLSLVYYILVRNSQIGDGAVLINREHQRLWGFSDEDLDLAAKKNTRALLPPDVLSITRMISELNDKLGCGHGSNREDGERGDADWEDTDREEGDSDGDSPMYVLTNCDRQFGACYMADKSILSQMAEREEDDLYILPSSVHECMIIPLRYGEDPEDLGKMVREINRTQVEEEEFLSDSVYYYDRITDQIEIAA